MFMVNCGANRCQRSVENETKRSAPHRNVCAIRNTHPQNRSKIWRVMKSNLFVINKFIRFIAHADRNRSHCNFECSLERAAESIVRVKRRMVKNGLYATSIITSE